MSQANPQSIVVRKGALVETDGFWYDLFEGGYIEPSELLLSGTNDVCEAIDTLIAFRDALEQAEAIKYY